MVDEIFEMILKEARARSGKNLIQNINTVFREISDKIIFAQSTIRESERRKKDHEE